jgi:hypothetical protein
MSAREYRAKAVEVQREYKRACAEINANGDLSETAKLRRVALETEAARAALRTLRDAEGRARITDAHDARARLFGLAGVRGSDVISHRDAADRAARCQTPRELREVLARAEAAGDTQLATACAARAWDSYNGTPGNAYGEIVRSWLDANPAKMPHAQALADVLDETGDKVKQLSNRLHFDLQVDKSLGHLNENQVLAQTGREEQV